MNGGGEVNINANCSGGEVVSENVYFGGGEVSKNVYSGSDTMTINSSWYSNAETLPMTSKNQKSESASETTCQQQEEEENRELQRAVDVNAKLDEWLRKERWLEKKRSVVNGCVDGGKYT